MAAEADAMKLPDPSTIECTFEGDHDVVKLADFPTIEALPSVKMVELSERLRRTIKSIDVSKLQLI